MSRYFETSERISTYFSHNDPVNPFLVTQRIDDNGAITKYTHKTNGDLASVEDALGNVTTYLYAEDLDPAPINPKHQHLLRKIQRAEVTLKEGAPDESQVTYQATELQYDTNGNLIKIIDAKNQETLLTYTAEGMVESVTDRRGHTTEFVYEGTAFDGSYRRLLQLKVPKGLQTTDGFRTVNFDYNDADNPDNVTGITNDLGHSVLTEYDIKDRVTKVTDARGKSTEFTFLDGLLDEIHLPANNGTSGEPRTISLVYDPHARLTEVRRDIDASNQQMIVKYAYNGFSELEKLIRLKDTVEKSFVFTRNALGRELTMEDPLQKITQTVWQSSCYGNSRTSARGVRVKTGVDMLCRISEIEAGDPEAFSSQDIDPVRETRTFHHDELGRLVKSTQLNLSRYGRAISGIDRYGDIPEEKLYEHDELDRLVKMRFRSDGDPAGARDETLSFEHDEEGNVTKITDPQGNVTEYTYYRDNLLYQVIIKRPGRPDRVFTYRYDAAGRLEEIEYPEDTEIKAIFKDASNTSGSGFDPNGNLMFLRYEKDGVLIRRFEFSYDDSNNRQSMLDVTPARAVKWEYGFDWLDRLVTVKRAEAANVGSLPATTLQRAYEFDESDNRTFFDDHLAGVTYHYIYKSIDDGGTTRWSDQLEEVLVSSTVGERNPANFSSFESFEHDDDGNLIARILTASGEEITFVWDDFDRLKRVESDQNGRMQDARYDVDGLRKRKLDKSGQNSVEYGLGISTSASVPGTVSSTAPSISYIMGHMILGCEIDGEFRYHLGDALSTVRDVVDDSGAVIKSLEFDEYGNLLSSSGSGTVSLKTFVGGLSVNDDTADSGMFNMGHRSYVAGVLGRFISRDPIGHRGGLNLYAYPTNPVSVVDPAGLEPLQTFDKHFKSPGACQEFKGDLIQADILVRQFAIEPSLPHVPLNMIFDFEASPRLYFKSGESGYWGATDPLTGNVYINAKALKGYGRQERLALLTAILANETFDFRHRGANDQGSWACEKNTLQNFRNHLDRQLQRAEQNFKNKGIDSESWPEWYWNSSFFRDYIDNIARYGTTRPPLDFDEF